MQAHRTGPSVACMVALVFSLMAPALAGGAIEADLAAKIAAAKAGQTVDIPAGEHAVTGLVLPPGVSLKGAGYAKTRLVVSGDMGIWVKDGTAAEISDLSISGAANTGVSLENCQGVVVRRVRASDCLNGFTLSGGQGNRIENCVAARNRTGMVLVKTARSGVVNCTIYGNSALAMSLSGTEACAAFNNVLVSSPIGVYVMGPNKGLTLDHNFYLTSFIGRGSDAPAPFLATWRDLSGYDAHSASMNIAFENEDQLMLKPTLALPWAQDLAVTQPWGVAKLGDMDAPTTDMDGQGRTRGVCTGAYEAPMKPACAADGEFEVTEAQGYTSAGLYDSTGRNVRFLFDYLPLPKGTYSFWLPSRDWKYEAVAPGKYELRLSQADLRLGYVGRPGNTGIDAAGENQGCVAAMQVVYDSNDRPVIVQGWSEGNRNFRAFDPQFEHLRWDLPGAAGMYGACSDGNGNVYALRQADPNTYSLIRLDEQTGRIFEVSPGVFSRLIPKATFSDKLGSLAVLGGRLYLADLGGNRLWITPLKDLAFAGGAEMPSPRSPVADRQRGLIWLLSGQQVLALDAQGKVKYTLDPKVKMPVSLGMSGNRLAVTSRIEGKVYLFDCTDPAAIKPAGQLGKGDGPYGAIEPDRFYFQNADPNAGGPGGHVAVSASGDVAVTDVWGVKLFDGAGKFKRELSGIWAQYNEVGLVNESGAQEMIELSRSMTFLLDPKSRTWKAGTYYDVPDKAGRLDFMFVHQGKRYGVTRTRTYACVTRFDGPKAVPLLGVSGILKGLSILEDFTLDANDPNSWKPVLDPNGKIMPGGNTYGRSCMPNSRGDLVGENFSVAFKGLDARGVPVYDWQNIQRVNRFIDKNAVFTSPYDPNAKENLNAGYHYRGFFADGSWAETLSLKTSRHSGYANWAGTDMAGYDPNGRLMWLQPTAQLKDAQGAKVVDDLVYMINPATSELQVFSKDGLYLGRMNAPKELYWHGMWLDNVFQFCVFKGNDGKPYVVYGNFNDSAMWWMEMLGIQDVKRQVVPVTVSEEKAQALAAASPPAPAKPPVASATKLTIVKLKEPLTIDGSMDKWRKAVPTPQIIATPEAASSDVTGPADCSAVGRVAYEGKNLYVQIITFDDVITTHQLLAQCYKQDAVELAINSFGRGFKFNIARTMDHGEAVYRERFVSAKFSKLMDLEHVQRKITVLDNARDVEERKVIERIYGVDLSNSKVLVTELKLPLDEDTYEGDLKVMPAVESGKSIWIGIMIDDNDFPGADIQKTIAWPATYGTFNPPETGALATFE